MTNFEKRVIEVVRAIPRGRVMSYEQVAEAAGRPSAARAVGNLMRKNQDKSVPCHRVIRNDGSVGPYNGLQGKDKRALLREEGVVI